jgi:hypothetical protein
MEPKSSCVRQPHYRGENMFRLSTQFLQDDDAMRSFYRSCGMSEQTIENAIKARKERPPEEIEVSQSGGGG